jgi:hypothetical protein
MPNPPRAKPRSKITGDRLCSQFYQLNQIDYIIFNKYRYKLDWESHNYYVRNARERIRVIQNDIDHFYNQDHLHNQNEFSDVQTTHDEATRMECDLANARMDYLDLLEKCDIIDEDGKICGEYFTSNKEYKIYYQRFIHNGKLYYRDDNNKLWSYLNSWRGCLKDDGETIGCSCPNCSCQNTVYEDDEDEDDEDEDEEDEEDEDDEDEDDDSIE